MDSKRRQIRIKIVGRESYVVIEKYPQLVSEKY